MSVVRFRLWAPLFFSIDKLNTPSRFGPCLAHVLLHAAVE
ncbi:hypothetical protein TRICHSKD4_4674 [Roseibium sp. TrichSKD4]|nr:hypothetical protein TRICHSKD4_4674 [Roseibium sp. TrichSKD4]